MSPAQAAAGIVDALKSSPLTLALVVMNIGLLIYLFYAGHQSQTAHNNYVGKTQDILSRCMAVDDFERIQRSLNILKGQ